MKKLISIAALLLPLFACAGTPIGSSDTGTFEVMGRDGNPTGMFYRLSQSGGTWKMEGKESASVDWHDISCSKGCAYSEVSESEAGAYLPAAMRAEYDIACIKNVAQAFCRYSMKTNSKQGGFAVMALVTGEPIFISVKRRSRG
ncbi:hypothetical protein [Pseudoduganella violaceinigra]|uniref:hypothetical protein n=1 Tax=Pseudoduganella violaceinigra TaxID=246602 RepID=UPI0004850DE7|nr:hypothetical protein [Pseudoduganella violaceinigra]